MPATSGRPSRISKQQKRGLAFSVRLFAVKIGVENINTINVEGEK